MFTFPQIGNYGVDEKNFQSKEVKALACVTREVAAAPEANEPMGRYFRDHGLLGVTGIDTRALTIRTRQHGTLRAALVCGDDASAEYAVELACAVPPITEQDLIPSVSTAEPYRVPGAGKRVAVIDLGVKKNMVISLFRRGADIGVFPHDTRSDVIEAWNPDALFITNGPGDPVRATDAIRCIRDLIGKLPVYGICMGNQLTALALGGTTHKMKFGHRGSNQPVQVLGRADLHHDPEPRVRRRLRDPARGRERLLHEPERRHGRGVRGPRPRDPLRPVPPRGPWRAAGYRVPLLRSHDAEASECRNEPTSRESC